MQGKSADALDEVIKQCNVTGSPTQKDRLKELRLLKNYRPCIDKEGRLRIEGRLSKSPDISWEAKHPLLLPSKHPLTRLVSGIVLSLPRLPLWCATYADVYTTEVLGCEW